MPSAPRYRIRSIRSALANAVEALEPLAFLRRLAWLVPPPRQHQLRYAGILAPAAKHRQYLALAEALL
jgi:hypothetical protein